MRKIVLDTETTGLKASDGHRIIELAMIELIDDEPSGRVFVQRFNPGVPISEGATAVNGITNEMLQGEPTFADRAHEIVDWLFHFSVSDYIGHCIRFDVDFINNELMFAQRKERLSDQDLIDTRILGKMLNPECPAKLYQLCEQHNVDISDLKLHMALDDATATTRLYQAIMKKIKGIPSQCERRK